MAATFEDFYHFKEFSIFCKSEKREVKHCVGSLLILLVKVSQSLDATHSMSINLLAVRLRNIIIHKSVLGGLTFVKSFHDKILNLISDNFLVSVSPFHSFSRKILGTNLIPHKKWNWQPQSPHHSLAIKIEKPAVILYFTRWTGEMLAKNYQLLNSQTRSNWRWRQPWHVSSLQFTTIFWSAVDIETVFNKSNLHPLQGQSCGNFVSWDAIFKIENLCSTILAMLTTQHKLYATPLKSCWLRNLFHLDRLPKPEIKF